MNTAHPNQVQGTTTCRDHHHHLLLLLLPQDPTGDAAAAAQKHLTYYELDLGLNHVLRKWSDPVDNGANLLIPVPGGGDGPSGVLVCAENFLIYRWGLNPVAVASAASGDDGV